MMRWTGSATTMPGDTPSIRLRDRPGLGKVALAAERATILPFAAPSPGISGCMTAQGRQPRSDDAFLFSTAEENPRDLMRPDTWAGNAPTMEFRRRCDGSAIGQDQDRAPGVEQTDDVIEIGDAAAPVRDVAPISTDRA